ncbi:mitofusin complex protein UGO1 [Aspergillus stella-maris]|uniref:mitofusin complex protein UGO1 n=1 Tax=Aspergillus stella-maris TaxID=1810926 RepID=UPI003CCDEA52
MSSRDGPNPLRPYYVPPAIGFDQDGSSAPPNASSAQVFGNTARDLLPDLDYSDYLETSPSVSGWVRDALDTAFKRYSTVLMAQPFDVAKIILQSYVVPDDSVGQFAKGDHQRSGRGSRTDSYDDMGSEEDEEADLSSDDESSYFTSAAPAVSSPTSRRPKPRHRITDRSGYITTSSSSRSTTRNALALKNPSSLIEVLSQLWTTSGPTSLWKATNATFIYSLLLPTLNTFIRSLLSAIVGLPEDDITPSMASDILTSTSPIVTLVLSFISSSLSAVLLSPIDTARTFLILTPATHGPRSLLRAIRQLPTPNYTIPPHLVPITILHSSLPSLILSSTPLFLKSYLSIDPVLHPSSWNILSFIGSGIEQAIRFPLETILRRAQIATFTSPSIRQNAAGSIRPAISDAAAQASEVETIVPTPQTYRGVVGTMWGIVYEEGVQPTPEAQRAREVLGKPVSTRKRQGQGIQGLYRGWRIGMWGVAGSLGLSLLNGAGGAEDGPMPSGGRF